jgi:hypothetical protein
VRTARRLAVESERAVARVSSPRPIDILVRISLYERTGLRPVSVKIPVSSRVVWPCTPDQTASPAVVTSSTCHRPMRSLLRASRPSIGSATVAHNSFAIASVIGPDHNGRERLVDAADESASLRPLGVRARVRRRTSVDPDG